MIPKITWSIYTADPLLVFLIWTFLVMLATGSIVVVVFVLSLPSYARKHLDPDVREENSALRARLEVLTKKLDEKESEVAQHSSIWTSILGTLARAPKEKS